MYVLIAVDGTLSRTAYNVGGNRSHVRRFHDGFGGSHKHFFEGPDSVLGFDVDEIAERAWRALVQSLAEAGDSVATRVVLVGHSRGGHIVAALARRLHGLRVGSLRPAFRAPGTPSREPTYGVHFLGLYDAVDMTDEGGVTDVIPPNVQYYAHALRSPELASRRSWGNTGWTRICSAHHMTRFFHATHGAIGGAPAEACSDEWAIVSDRCAVPITAESNRREGLRAHEFIVGHARLAGVPV